MKRIFRLFRIATACVGTFLLFNAAGTDQMYANMRQMPPESVDKMIVWGLLLLIPTALHFLNGERKVKKNAVHR